ncbi:hypothetical protein T484DRAFT_1890541, partial [Baffinella frigidus]
MSQGSGGEPEGGSPPAARRLVGGRLQLSGGAAARLEEGEVSSPGGVSPVDILAGGKGDGGRKLKDRLGPTAGIASAGSDADGGGGQGEGTEESGGSNLSQRGSSRVSARLGNVPIGASSQDESTSNKGAGSNGKGASLKDRLGSLNETPRGASPTAETSGGGDGDPGGATDNTGEDRQTSRRPEARGDSRDREDARRGDRGGSQPGGDARAERRRSRSRSPGRAGERAGDHAHRDGREDPARDREQRRGGGDAAGRDREGG